MPTLDYQNSRRERPSPQPASRPALILAWLAVGISLAPWFLLSSLKNEASRSELGMMVGVGNILLSTAATAATGLLLLLWLTFAPDCGWSGRAIAVLALVSIVLGWGVFLGS